MRTDNANLPAGVTPATATSKARADCPLGDWSNSAAPNNHDAAAGLLKHLARAGHAPVTRAEVAATLRAAVDVIARNGFSCGAMVDPGQEQSGMDPRDCAVCPRAAIAIAAGQGPRYMLDAPVHEIGRYTHSLIKACEVALAKALIDRGYAGARILPQKAALVIEEYADDQDRTDAEVMDMLAAAADAQEAP